MKLNKNTFISNRCAIVGLILKLLNQARLMKQCQFIRVT